MKLRPNAMMHSWCLQRVIRVVS